jgi:predicted  nucleic acid-binding Zn-ribbon protein
MDIEGLQIEITENSEKAVAGLDALTLSLDKLKNVTKGLERNLEGVNFDKFTIQIKKLSSSLQPLQGFKTQATGLISALRHFKTTAEDFNEFTRFDKFASQIKLLAESLKPLSNFNTKLGATLNALTQLPATSEQLETVNFNSFGEKITSLSQSLSPLGTIQSKLGATLNQLTRFGQVTQQLDMVLRESDVSENILNLVKALEPLSTLGKSNLGSTLNQLKKLPEIIEQLHKVDMEAFGNQIERVVTAIKPLADEMNKVAAGFNAFPARIQKLITQSERLARTNKKLSGSYNILGISVKAIYTKIGLLYLGLKKTANLVSDWVIESNKYVENLNLFRVSMRGAADEALDYAFKVKEAFGIDPSEWIRFQAVFQNMYTGFGVAADKATIMSKTLTQLGYDLATIFNVDYDIAMEKLESAIAGQPRPMREWGFDMSEATLKLVALKHGIEENVETMTQYEKSQLRFIQLMETARKQGILGNFAREIHTPANALRILNQQFLLLRRSLGDMFVPLLMKILPYVQASVQALTELANWVANLLGFELPKIDYSGLEGIGFAADDATEGLEDATDAANKLNKALAPFDEINLLNLGDEIGKSLGRLDLGIDLGEYDYDFLAEAVERQVDRIMDKIRPTITWIKDNFFVILDVVKSIGIAFAAWKLSNFFLDNINNLRNLLKGEVEPITKIATGLTLIITGVYLEFQGAKAIGKGEAELFDYIKTALGAALGIAGSLLIFGTGPLGWAIGIGAALTVFITGVNVGARENLSELVKEAFYDGGNGIAISDVVIEFKNITASISENAEIILQGQERIEGLRNSVNDTNKSISEITESWKKGVIGTDEAVKEITELIEQLKQDTEGILDEIYDNIVEAIGGSFGAALIEAGYSIPEVLNFLREIRDESKSNISTVIAELEELNKKFEETGVLTEKEQARQEELLNTLTNMVGANKELENSLDKIAKGMQGVDWESPEKTKEALDKVKGLISETRDKLIESSDSLIDGFETLRKNITDEAKLIEIDKFIKIQEKAAENDLKKLEDETKKLFDGLQVDIISKMASVVKEAEAEWEEMNFIQRLFSGHNHDSYVAQALIDFRENTVQPIEEEILKGMEELGIEGSVFASEAVDTILSNMFTYDHYYGYYYDFKRELDEDTYNLLTEYGINAKEWANQAGIDIASGLFEGMKEQIEKDKPWYEKVWNTIQTWFKNIFGIKSPSTVFEGFGENIMEGLLKGMEGWDIDFENIFKGIVNTGIEMINKFISWLNSTLSFSWSDKYVMGVKVLSAGSIQFVNIPQIPKLYARGGFPSTGELFVAREAGPELVGSIGGRTAVVNNDQIVEAVSQGVYEAVSMAIRLNARNENSGDIVINLEGRPMARILLKNLNEEAQRLGYAPILRYAEGGV